VNILKAAKPYSYLFMPHHFLNISFTRTITTVWEILIFHCGWVRSSLFWVVM